MSTPANPAVAAVFRAVVINANHPASNGVRVLVAGLASRLQRFVDGLPERHGDIDVQVLKQVPTPI